MALRTCKPEVPMYVAPVFCLWSLDLNKAPNHNCPASAGGVLFFCISQYETTTFDIEEDDSE